MILLPSIKTPVVFAKSLRLLLSGTGLDMGEPAGAAVYACLCDEDTSCPLKAVARFIALRVFRVAMPSFCSRMVQDLAGWGLSIGTPEAPEMGASLVLEAQSFSPNGDAKSIRARGAGIQGEALFWLDAATAALLVDRPHWPYPLGVDVILTSGAQIVALPRHLAWEVI